MPIYEFYCPECHTVFSFLARVVDTKKQPACPRCSRPKLERRVSRFAISKGRGEKPEAAGPAEPDLDDPRMEQMMEELAREADNINEDDPRQVARLMRRLCEGSGMPVNEQMEEALRRMESGEDPDRIEEEMGDVFGDDAMADADLPPAEGKGKLKSLSRRLRPPSVDDTLYDM